MKLIVGLGNPGKEYEKTRHNVGFLVVEELARRLEVQFKAKRSIEGEIAEATLNGERILLLKPLAFMNISGRPISTVMKKYPITVEEILVIYDDADIEFKDVRIKSSGGSAGHRGMESVLAQFPKGTSVARLRVGIGRPHHPDIQFNQFVLQKWTKLETKELPEIIDKAITIIYEHTA